MKPTTISYGRTYNTGNYESRRFDVSAELEEGEDLSQAMAQLADQLHAAAKRVLQPPAPRRSAAAGDDEDESEIPF